MLPYCSIYGALPLMLDTHAHRRRASSAHVVFTLGPLSPVRKDPCGPPVATSTTATTSILVTVAASARHAHGICVWHVACAHARNTILVQVHNVNLTAPNLNCDLAAISNRSYSSVR
jgi:hypothetical protein